MIVWEPEAASIWCEHELEETTTFHRSGTSHMVVNWSGMKTYLMFKKLTNVTMHIRILLTHTPKLCTIFQKACQCTSLIIRIMFMFSFKFKMTNAIFSTMAFTH